MGRQEEFLTLINIKRMGRGSFKYAFKIFEFKTESGAIIRWGTKTTKNFEIGFKARCSFSVVNRFIEDKQIVLAVEDLRMRKV